MRHNQIFSLCIQNADAFDAFKEHMEAVSAYLIERGVFTPTELHTLPTCRSLAACCAWVWVAREQCQAKPAGQPIDPQAVLALLLDPNEVRALLDVLDHKYAVVHGALDFLHREYLGMPEHIRVPMERVFHKVFEQCRHRVALQVDMQPSGGAQ